jgi:hypothetical protein
MIESGIFKYFSEIVFAHIKARDEERYKNKILLEKLMILSQNLMN